MAQPPLVFKVRRKAGELISPAEPTPREWKQLSDIDDQAGLRFHVPIVLLYRKHELGRDPTKAIKVAIAEALVSYYPLAGRLREKDGRKIVVECNGEGIMFIEAEANVSVYELIKDELKQHFPCMDGLFFDKSISIDVLHTSLIFIQVTKLKCGGFILYMLVNHMMADASGMVQFLKAAAEISRGVKSLSIHPVWDRHLLFARDPPQNLSCTTIRDYDEIITTKTTLFPSHNIVHKSFFFGPTEVSTLRRQLPPHLKSSTTFDVITACLWRCRTIALQPDPQEAVRISFIVDARSKFNNPPIPNGYYGNVVAGPTATTTADKLCCDPLGDIVEVVKKAKDIVTEEYMKLVADLLVIRDKPHHAVVGTFLVTDTSMVGFNKLDFGWGPPVYGGLAKSGMEHIFKYYSIYVRFENKKGEKGTLALLSLPPAAMDRFIMELHKMLSSTSFNPPIIRSAL